MLKSSVYGYRDVYIIFRGTIAIARARAVAAAQKAHQKSKRLVISQIDIVMSIFNLTEHSDNYVEILGGLRQYHKDIPNDNIADSESF